MIKSQNLEKVILDLTYVSGAETIALQIQKAGRQIVTFYAEEGNTQGTLYLTDDIRKATAAKQKGYAVLIYLHDCNKNVDFNGFQYFIEGFEDADDVYYERVYCREKNLPWIIGETNRLIVREMTQEDTDALYKLYEDKSVVKFMDDLPENKEEESIYIQEYINKMYGVFGFGMWLIVLKETAQVIGRIGFQNSEEAEEVEFGFMIAPDYQGKGYAYEAGNIALAYMAEEFPDIHIMAKCHPDNKAAIALCKKLCVEVRLSLCYNFC